MRIKVSRLRQFLWEAALSKRSLNSFRDWMIEDQLESKVNAAQCIDLLIDLFDEVGSRDGPSLRQFLEDHPDDNYRDEMHYPLHLWEKFLKETLEDSLLTSPEQVLRDRLEQVEQPAKAGNSVAWCKQVITLCNHADPTWRQLAVSAWQALTIPRKMWIALCQSDLSSHKMTDALLDMTERLVTNWRSPTELDLPEILKTCRSFVRSKKPPHVLHELLDPDWTLRLQREDEGRAVWNCVMAAANPDDVDLFGEDWVYEMERAHSPEIIAKTLVTVISDPASMRD